MVFENKVLSIKEEYEAWLDREGEDSLLPILILIAIHNKKSLEGYELLPNWVRGFLEKELEHYRESKEFKIWHAEGVVDHSDKMQTFDLLRRKQEK
ncbi:hypothetical protein ACJJIR_08295 [Microbulbifer sp. SSSA008]|uniref:hypothetical protein n=1 Tax=Microbulbifer sp. SSSA008 TaxID=3243380 RepID=UPI00403A3F9E